MPSPTSLVVKNGSNALRDHLRRHARAGVADDDADILPGGDLGIGGVGLVEKGIRRFDRELAAVGHGVARIDREVEQRASRAGRRRRRSSRARRRARSRSRMVSPRVRRSRSDMPVTRRVDGDRSSARAAGCARRRAGDGRAARRARRRAAPTLASRSSAGSLRSARRRCSDSILPVMTVSRLLKSCAMPPVSWPIASIFCAWRSRSSLARRSVMSRVILAKPIRLPPSPRIALMTTLAQKRDAVLAQSPALHLVFAALGGDGKRPRRDAGRAVVLGVEAREMLADDLCALIALDALGARVPAHDVALRIEHEDRVIGHGVDQ